VLRVVEVAGSVAGAYAGKLFAESGAHVTRLEGGGDEQVDALRLHLDADKEVAPLEPERLEARLAAADVVIESSAPDPLRPIAGEPGQRVLVQISPFGASGPYATWRSNAFTDDALGGHLYLNGEPHREPLARPGLHAHYQAGLHAFIGALAALRSGRGQRVEVSHLEGLASMHQHTTAMFTHSGHVLMREGNRQPGYWHPAGVYPCRDGHVLLDLAISEHRDRFLAVTDLPELLVDSRFADDFSLGEHKDAFDEAILPWLLDHDAEEIVSRLQEVGVPAGPVPNLQGVLEDPHLAARQAWREVEGVRVPARAVRIEARRAADGVVTAARPRRDPSEGPLAGIRVLDLSRVWAGPFAGRLLADLGADVIAIESPSARGGRDATPWLTRRTHLFPDDDAGDHPWNRIGPTNELLRNKRGITLDLKRPEARAVFERLVPHCDVVLTNFSHRVMPGLGLDLARLLELHPRLIYTAISGFGASGPHRDRVALGPLAEASSGLTASMGYRDSGPYRAGVAWTDPITGLHAVAGTLMALRERDDERAPMGRVVEVSMLEAMLSVCGERIAERQLRGEEFTRRGNRHAAYAPQGVYPCAGEERWVALSITSDDEWRALCTSLALDEKFRELGSNARQLRHDEIDDAIGRATRDRDRDALARRLQAAGVIAVRVADAQDLCHDPHLAARAFWAESHHAEAGDHLMPGCAIRLDATPARYRAPAPRLGEHNREVLRQLAGYDDAALSALERQGILVDTPPSAGPVGWGSNKEIQP
jgi:crotonobetainyl-CoA:carnitine CoA-transferase CaiB-like acyl-CoA transferase